MRCSQEDSLFRFWWTRSSTFELEADSLAIRLVQATIGRLEFRLESRTTYARHLSTIALDREWLDRNPSRSADDQIIRRLGGRGFPGHCVFLDEVRLYDKGRLHLHDASEIERIEIYGKGAMVRVYTQPFVARKLGGSNPFRPIRYFPMEPGPDVCR